MSNVIAIVKTLVGQAEVISPEGIRRQLIEGDRLFKGDQLVTGPAASVSLALTEGGDVDVSASSQWSEPASSNAVQAATEPGSPSQEPSSAGELAQPMTADIDPTIALEAPAAGPAAAGGAGSVGGAHSFVLLDATGARLDPTVGFNTQGRSFTPLSDTSDDSTNINLTPIVDDSLAVEAFEDDATFDFDLLAGTVDPDQNDTLNVSNVQGLVAGLTLNGNRLVIDPSDASFQSLAVGETRDITVTYDILDGNGGTVAQSATITIKGTNDAPVAQAASVTVAEDAAVISGSVVATDVDANAALSFALNNAAPAGLTFNNDGSYSFDAANSAYQSLGVGQSAVLTIPYTVTDDQGATSGANLVITVTGTNDAPVANPDSYSTDEDTSITRNLLANDTDVDNPHSDLFITQFSVKVGPFNIDIPLGQATNLGLGPLAIGQITIASNGDFTFTPAANYNGPVPQFSYTLSDGSLSDSSTLNIEINAINDAPVNSLPNAQSVNEDGSLSLNGSKRISVGDVDDNSLSTTLSVEHGVLNLGSTFGITVTGNGTGSLTLSGNKNLINIALNGLRYAPTADYDGTDTLTVTTTDGELTDVDTVGITVNPVNDAPINIVPTSIDVIEDVASAITGISIADSDAKGGNMTVTLAVGAGTLSAASAAGVTVADSGTGSLQLTGTVSDINAFIANSNVSYTTVQNANGTVELTISTNDNGNTGLGGAKSDTDTLTLNITPINDAPAVANPLTPAPAYEDGTGLDIDLLAGTSDVDTGDILSVSNVQGLVDGLSLNGNNLSVNPGDASFQSLAADETLDIQVTFDVIDGNGGVTPQTLTVTITGTNDAPTLTGVRNSFNYNESQGSGISYTRLDNNVVLNDIDSSNFAGGSLSINISNAVADQDLLIVQNQGNGVGQIRVVGTDVRYNAGSGSESIGTISGGTNGAPLVISLNDKATPAAVDALMQRVAYGNSSQTPDTTPRTVSITMVDGDGTAHGGTDSVTANITINVRPGNDTPINSLPTEIAVAEDVASPLSGFSISDVDAGNADVQVTLGVPSGSLSATSGSGVIVSGSASSLVLTGSVSAINAFIANSNISYTTAQDANDSVTLTVTTNDLGNTGRGGAKFDIDTLTLNITPVNDAPFATADGYTTNEDTLLVVDAAHGVLSNDIDVDNPATALSAVLVDVPAHGNLTLNADGSFSFQPATNWSGSDSFTYRTFDGTDYSAQVTVSLGVTAVADAPTLNLTGTETAAATDFQSVELNGSAWSANIDTSQLNNGLGGTWHTDNPGRLLEVGKESTYMGGSSNNQVFELERNTGDPSNLYTDVTGTAGSTYSLDVDYSPRSGQTGNSSIEVFWGGNLITTLTSGSVGFQTYHFDLPMASDGTYRLEFKAVDSNSLGGLLDNIRLDEVRNTGNEDSWIRLSDIQANLTDTDTSETLAVTISGIPVGAQLQDNDNNTFTATDGNTEIDVSDWDLSTLSILPPTNFNGTFPLTVTATATEGANSDSASTSQTWDVTVLPVNDAPVLTVTAAAALLENSAEANDVVATFTSTDEEDGTPDVDFTPGSNDDGYYAISGSNVVLTSAGATFVQGGGTLPAVNLTATDSGTPALTDNDSATPTVTAQNDAPAITVTAAAALLENSAAANDVVATFTATDEEDVTPDVDFTPGSNDDGYYAISGSNVVLTAAGATFVQGGGTLPAVNLTATDSGSPALTDSASATPSITPVADAPDISVTLGSATNFTTTINNGNANSTGLGYSVTAFNTNGSAGTISFNSSPVGFGVTGGVSGADSELGQSGSNSEKINVAFNTPVSSVTVVLAWLSTSEKAAYKLFDSTGAQIGSGTVTGKTDNIDPAITLTGSGLISTIEFTAVIDSGTSDYLIHSISYVNSTQYPLTITASPAEMDGTETITGIKVTIPDDATLSVGTHNADGSWTLPLETNGGYTVEIDPATQAITISGLEMTVPPGTPPNVIVSATVTDGLSTVNTITGTGANDLINGTADDDILSGGLGNDDLTGGLGADSFTWKSGHTGNDVIKDFNAAEGDRIDLHDLLQNEEFSSDITQYLRVDIATSTLEISSNGTLAADGSNADVTIKLENGSGGNALPDYAGMSQLQIINSLIAGADPLVKVDHS